jgi:hypothetical protein
MLVAPPGGELRQAARAAAAKGLRTLVRFRWPGAIWNNYRSGFGFHSRASFCASAICAGVILVARSSLMSAAGWSPA